MGIIGKATAFLTVFLGTSVAQAETPSYAAHRGVTVFTDQPCGVVLSAMDSPDVTVEESLEDGLLAEGFLNMGMYWGFILGFDTAKGGLNSETQTTLERLTDECAKSPEKTAHAILLQMR